MIYKIVLNPQVDNDLEELSHMQKTLVFKQLKKISTSAELGQMLGNKNGYDLTGYRKMYADKK